MNCPDCEAKRALVRCDSCSLTGISCHCCGSPAERWQSLDKYMSYPYCGNCSPFILFPDGRIGWLKDYACPHDGSFEWHDPKKNRSGDSSETVLPAGEQEEFSGRGKREAMTFPANPASVQGLSGQNVTVGNQKAENFR